jgi:hypothetical protein
LGRPVGDALTGSRFRRGRKLMMAGAVQL